MTKEQFLSGASFYIGTKAYKGDSTYYFQNNIICRESRSSIDERVVIDAYEANVYLTGKTYVEAYTYVLNKKVKVKLKYENLKAFEEGV